MASFEIDDKEFQAWANRVQAQAQAAAIKPKLQTVLTRVGQYTLGVLKTNTPVDTGTLRRGWHAVGSSYGIDGWQVTLANNVEYAYYVENGHRTPGGRGWVAGQFFVKKSADQIQDKLPEMVSEVEPFKGLLS